jgi:2-methylcitrate dehydratase PrpD
MTITTVANTDKALNKGTAASEDTRALVEFMTHAATAPLREAVVLKAKHHVIDTFAAIVSGAKLEAGIAARPAAAPFMGSSEATVLATGERLPMWAAALVNAMYAHADETDDSHEQSRFHPGCGIVPTALAAAEFRGASGLDFLRAVAAGYDVGARVNEAFGPGELSPSGHSSHAYGALWGCGGAAAALFGLGLQGNSHYVSYLAHETSGLSCWVRDPDHVQKAYVFGGMGAKNALITAQLCQAGWTGARDMFHGERALFQAVGLVGKGRTLSAPWTLGDEILRSNIKKWCVGSPVQAALDALEAMGSTLPDDGDRIRRIDVEIRADEAYVVAARGMTNISLPHLVALYVIDGGLTFHSVHDTSRVGDPRVAALAQRVNLLPSDELQRAGGRQAIVSLALDDGTLLRHHTAKVRGTWQNPVTSEEIQKKASELMEPILGVGRTKSLTDLLWRLETLDTQELAAVVRLAVEE